MTETRTIRRAYPRSITLDTGTTVALRLMTAADAHLIVAFARSLPPDDLLFLRTDITDPRVVAQWVRDLEAVRKLVAQMTVDQPGAIATFERLGFRPEALLQDFVIDRAGRTRDVVVAAYDVEGLTEHLD